MEEITTAPRLDWKPYPSDYKVEPGLQTWKDPKWYVVPCPVDATFLELFAPIYPQVPKGEKVERWQLRSGNGFVATRPTAEECMELAALMQMLIDGDDVSLVVAILERLRDRPKTRGKHFFEEMIVIVKNLDWTGA